MDTKILRDGTAWCYSRLSSCRAFSINSNQSVSFVNRMFGFKEKVQGLGLATPMISGMQ